MSKKKTPPSLESSIYDCVLITQKVEEWRRILESARDNPIYSEKQIAELQKKIGRMTEIIFKVHGRTKWPDEVIGKMYYGCLDIINEIRESFTAWSPNKSMLEVSQFIIERPHIRRLIEDNFLTDEWTLEEISKYLIAPNPAPEIAVEFVATDTGLSEDRIRKKIKKVWSG